MMYVTTRKHGSTNPADDKTFYWHVGESRIMVTNNQLMNFDIEVQADGDELEHIIRHQLCYCPAPINRRVVRFFGDEARRIVANL